MIYRGYISCFVFLYIVCTIGLQIPKNERATFPTPVIPREILTSTRTQYPTTPTLLYLPVTSEEPDTLGISEINGLFGPGAWSGWFLTLVASWWRIFRVSEEKFDPNTIVFLFSTNWAAVDVWRGFQRAHSIPLDAPDYNARFNRGLGSLGAAYNVMFWGTFHGQLQLAVAFYVFHSSKAQARRMRTHAVGLLLPLVTLLRFLPSNYEHSPALYWHGMESGTHESLLLYAFLAGFLVIAIVVWFIIEITTILPIWLTDWANAVIARIASDRLRRSIQILAIFSHVSCLISFILLSIFGNYRWAFGFLFCIVYWFIFYPFSHLLETIFTLIMGPIIIAFMFLLMLEEHMIEYTFKAYVTRSVDHSKSCFFMPCAPQSITDEDQLQSLVISLSLFLVFDFVPVVWGKIKARYREKKDFVLQMERRMKDLEMRQRVRSRFGREEA